MKLLILQFSRSSCGVLSLSNSNTILSILFSNALDLCEISGSRDNEYEDHSLTAREAVCNLVGGSATSQKTAILTLNQVLPLGREIKFHIHTKQLNKLSI
jgi:hypothetical protein